jgi:hypothetical protein
MARVGDEPVRLFLNTVISSTFSFARIAPKVRSTVPIPAVTVPALATHPFVPSEGWASRAAWIFASRVLFVADHVIAEVLLPSNLRMKVPPVGVPPIVSVCTSLVPAVKVPRSRSLFGVDAIALNLPFN